MTRFEVKVIPRASRNEVEVDAGRYRVRVTAAPEGGKANQAVLKLLAKHLGVGKGNLKIVGGEKGRLKTVIIDEQP